MILIQENSHNINTWHEDVQQFFDVYDDTGELGGFRERAAKIDALLRHNGMMA